MATSLSSPSIAHNTLPALSATRPVPVENIGRPHTFASGPLAPCTVRMELEEVQKPDLGRKFARKDKRPLDPPPVVLCRFFQLLKGPDGRHIEVEMDPAIPSLGAVCHLDLFPVPPQFYQAGEHHQQPNQTTIHSGHPAPDLSQGSYLHIPTTTLSNVHNRPMATNDVAQTAAIPSSGTMSSLHGATTPNHNTAHAVTSSASPTIPSGPSALLPYAGNPSTLPGAHVTPDLEMAAQWQEAAVAAGQTLERDILATYGDFQIRESSKCSDALSGTTSTHAEVIDYKGKKSAVFVFSDVAVKSEGTFVLRYRLFNILSKVAIGSPAPALAECFGGPFKIYSSKEFPGLQASTELTKSLALYGVRVNMRETPRRRRRDSEMPDGPDGQEEEEAGARQNLPDGYHNHPLRTTAAAGARGHAGAIAIPGPGTAGPSVSPTSLMSRSPSGSGWGSPFPPGPAQSVHATSRPSSGASGASASRAVGARERAGQPSAPAYSQTQPPYEMDGRGS